MSNPQPIDSVLANLTNERAWILHVEWMLQLKAEAYAPVRPPRLAVKMECRTLGGPYYVMRTDGVYPLPQ